MNRDTFEELKTSLQEAVEQWKRDNPPKKTMKDAVVSNSPSYKDLPDEEYDLFMDVVKSEWDEEKHKEGYIRSYDQVINDCWKDWNRK